MRTIPRPPPTPPGFVLVLNGCSSSGKSSIATALQRSQPLAMLHLQLDAFRAMEPQSYFGPDQRDQAPLRVAALCRAMHAAATECAAQVLAWLQHRPVPRAYTAMCETNRARLAQSATTGRTQNADTCVGVTKYRHNSQMESVETQSVRLAVTSDLPSLMESDTHAHNHSERQSFLAAAIERGECLVGFTGTRVVGYIVLNYSFFGRGFIPLVVVAPSVRRQGIAQQLFAAAESKCRTAMLFTSTNASNLEAQRLFARVGFAASGRIENLDEGDPELVYVKRCAPVVIGGVASTAGLGAGSRASAKMRFNPESGEIQ